MTVERGGSVFMHVFVTFAMDSDGASVPDMPTKGRMDSPVPPATRNNRPVSELCY